MKDAIKMICMCGLVCLFTGCACCATRPVDKPSVRHEQRHIKKQPPVRQRAVPALTINHVHHVYIHNVEGNKPPMPVKTMNKRNHNKPMMHKKPIEKFAPPVK